MFTLQSRAFFFHMPCTSINITMCRVLHSVLSYVFLPQVDHAYFYTICECSGIKETLLEHIIKCLRWQLSIFCLHWYHQVWIHCLLPVNRHTEESHQVIFLLILWFTKFMVFPCFMRERGRRLKTVQIKLYILIPLAMTMTDASLTLFFSTFQNFKPLSLYRLFLQIFRNFQKPLNSLCHWEKIDPRKGVI